VVFLVAVGFYAARCDRGGRKCQKRGTGQHASSAYSGPCVDRAVEEEEDFNERKQQWKETWE